MKKIPTLFVRDDNDRRHVTDQVTPGCEWVIAGEGTPTRKYDGTCVMLDERGRWWARREVGPGKTSPPLWRFISADTTTGKSVGWEPIDQSGFAKFHAEALVYWDNPITAWEPGTYELVGQKINGNPEHQEGHRLIPHGADPIWFPLEPDASLIAHTVRRLGADGIEGVVWHHPDGRMAKLKARDVT